MSNRLLVGNLSLETTESSLEKFFSGAGLVKSVTLITDHSGKRRGFAFVEMSNRHEAQKAVRVLNGADVDGRSIIINLSEQAPNSQPFLSKFIKSLLNC